MNPQKYMKTLTRAWEHGIDKEVTEKYMALNMRIIQSRYAEDKSDEFMMGFSCAMVCAEELLKRTVPYSKTVDRWENRLKKMEGDNAKHDN